MLVNYNGIDVGLNNNIEQVRLFRHICFTSQLTGIVLLTFTLAITSKVEFQTRDLLRAAQRLANRDQS